VVHNKVKENTIHVLFEEFEDTNNF